MRIKTLLAAGFATALLGAATACDAVDGQAAGEDYPTQEMDWTIAFGPGGGNDIMARVMVDILEKEDLYPQDIRVENREGGSGATGWGHLYGQTGTGYGLSTTSGSFLTTPLQADTGWEPQEFTPVGLFATDNLLFTVDANSDIESWEEWVDYATEQEEVVVGGIGTVNVDFIVHQILAEEAGYEIDYVAFNDEGQVQTSLLSGALDASVHTTGSILGQVDAEEVTPLLYSGAEPIEALPDVPIAEDHGYDLPAMPRGMILPPDAPEEAQQWWIETMQEVVETEEWQDYIEENHLTEELLWGDDFMDYVDSSMAEFEEVLSEAGAV